MTRTASRTWLLTFAIALSVACAAPRHQHSDGALAISAARDQDRVADQIREAIKRDESLSSPARDIKVTMVGNVVTLRGLARTDVEKERIGNVARDIAGPDRKVDNGVELIHP